MTLKIRCGSEMLTVNVSNFSSETPSHEEAMLRKAKSSIHKIAINQMYLVVGSKTIDLHKG